MKSEKRADYDGREEFLSICQHLGQNRLLILGDICFQLALRDQLKYENDLFCLTHRLRSFKL